MNKYLSKLSFGILGFVAGIAFLISCGSDDGSPINDSNAADSAVKAYYVVDAANVSVGRLAGIGGLRLLTAITDEGYMVVLESTGQLFTMIADLRFATTDCTGQAYVQSAMALNGAVLKTGNEVIYVPASANEIDNFQHESTKALGSDFCTTISGNSGTVVPANQNDVTVTGVPDNGFQGKLTIQLR